MANHQILRVKPEEVFADFDRNFRHPEHDYADCYPQEGYDHEKFLAGKGSQGMFESIFYNGIIVPLWVAILTASQIAEVFARTGRTFKYRVIRGHKRFFTLLQINQRFPGHIDAIDVDAYEGLSELREWELLADHGSTQRETPLTEEGEYRAVVNLFAAGFSQEKIAGMFNQKRGWSMRRVWVHQMGTDTPIETHYLKRFDPKAEKGTFYTFPLSDVDKLHTAWTADNEANRSPMDAEASFAKLWSLYEETGKQPAEPKALTRKAIDERAGFVKGRPALEEMIKYASGRGGNTKTAADMYDRIAAKAEKAEALQTDLDSVKVSHEETLAKLATSEARVAELTAEVASLRAEIKTLRAGSKPAAKK